MGERGGEGGREWRGGKEGEGGIKELIEKESRGANSTALAVDLPLFS